MAKTVGDDGDDNEHEELEKEEEGGIQYIGGSVQDCSIAIANALEILQSWIKLSIWWTIPENGTRLDRCYNFLASDWFIRRTLVIHVCTLFEDIIIRPPTTELP